VTTRATPSWTIIPDQRDFLVGALPQDAPRIDAAIRAAETAYADYARFLERDVLPHAGADFAAGRELFELLLHERYFLQEDADRIYQMGQRSSPRRRRRWMSSPGASTPSWRRPPIRGPR
jgi:hypothetical protein